MEPNTINIIHQLLVENHNKAVQAAKEALRLADKAYEALHGFELSHNLTDYA